MIKASVDGQDFLQDFGVCWQIQGAKTIIHPYLLWFQKYATTSKNQIEKTIDVFGLRNYDEVLFGNYYLEWNYYWNYLETFRKSRIDGSS